MADAALVLLGRDELPVRSVAQLVEMMREKPGQLNYSTGGYGSPHQLAATTLFHPAGLPQNIAVHVPFSGLAPALMALLAGNAQFMITSTGAAAQHIASGKLRPLATTGLKRSPRLPEMPTMAELGYAGFEVLAWCGWRRRPARPSRSLRAGTSSPMWRCAIPRCALRYRRSITRFAAARRRGSPPSL